MSTHALPPLGAFFEADRTRFRAFATAAERCAVRLYRADGSVLSTHEMHPVHAGAELEIPLEGYFEIELNGVGPGALYRFVVGEQELPDPYARFLPQGVHGPAMVMVPRHRWQHGPGVARPLAEQVLYEIHVGTFTPEGTYEAARARLAELAALGITTIELMPLAAFAGARGWGYDGVALYAPFAGYGDPDDLRRFIDEAHGLRLGVILDAVYNHFGPSGNYLSAYSPSYFRRDVASAWGEAPNFEHPVMRRLVLDNARYWLEEFRFDGLRLDATHAIHDGSHPSILRELADVAAGLEPRKLLIAEDERNEPAMVAELGMDAVWADDFHHQVHVTLTGERDGYYGSYEPGAAGIARAVERGWLYEGEQFPPAGKPRGKSAEGLPASAFVYCIQNHDQVGNRALGERLSADVSLDAYCAACALLLLLPMTPLLFMGQEWAATSPFLYFTDHEEELGRAVSRGRREEFKSFSAFTDPEARAAIPDPQALETFQRSKLHWEERDLPPHRRVLELHRTLLALRRDDPVFAHGARERLRAGVIGDLLAVRQWNGERARLVLANLSPREAPLPNERLRGFTFSWSSAAVAHQGVLPAWTTTIWTGAAGTEPG